MHKYCFVFFFFVCGVQFSQKRILKKIENIPESVEISTKGLDNITLENTNSNFIEVELYAESYDDQLIKINKSDALISVSFEFEGAETREVIFRKFITKRLQRANAIIRIPKQKTITIFGENIDVTSKKINNNLSVYIENGIVKLHKVQQNTLVKLYAGTVYMSTKDADMDITSNLGEIEVDDVIYHKKYQESSSENDMKFTLQTIKGNVFITTK